MTCSPYISSPYISMDLSSSVPPQSLLFHHPNPPRPWAHLPMFLLLLPGQQDVGFQPPFQIRAHATQPRKDCLLSIVPNMVHVSFNIRGLCPDSCAQDWKRSRDQMRPSVSQPVYSDLGLNLKTHHLLCSLWAQGNSEIICEASSISILSRGTH